MIQKYFLYKLQNLIKLKYISNFNILDELGFIGRWSRRFLKTILRRKKQIVFI